MAAQIGPATVVIEPAGLLQLAKHAHKTLWCKTGGSHQAVPHAIGLALHRAREIQLVLHHRRRPAHHDGHGRIGAARGCQRPQQHGGQHQRRLLALLGQHARNVALRDVAGFVGNHRGQLVAAADHADQPQIHAHIATGQRKCVDLAVLAQNQRPRKAVFQLLRKLTILARRIL